LQPCPDLDLSICNGRGGGSGDNSGAPPPSNGVRGHKFIPRDKWWLTELQHELSCLSTTQQGSAPHLKAHARVRCARKPARRETQDRLSSRRSTALQPLSRPSTPAAAATACRKPPRTGTWTSCWRRRRCSPRPSLAPMRSHLTAAAPTQRKEAGAAHGNDYPLCPHRGG
jgi:hypothetical protein